MSDTVAPHDMATFPAKSPPYIADHRAGVTDNFRRPQHDPRHSDSGLLKAAQQIGAPVPAARNADKPMTYLVRQLLGQIPVDSNDPAFVLSPHLVKNASKKVQLVIEKLIEAAVKRTKEKGNNTASGATSSRLDEMNRELRLLNQFAQERAHQVLDQSKIIAELQRTMNKNMVDITKNRNQLEALRLQSPPMGGSAGGAASALFDDSEHDETVRTLVQKLQRVIATVQNMNKEIEACRLVATRDEIDLQQKDDVIKLLRALIETECAIGKQQAAADAKKATALAAVAPAPLPVPAPEHPPPDSKENKRKMSSLKMEIDSLKDALLQQRSSSEHRMKVFMDASLQALEKQSDVISGRKRKNMNA